MIIQNSEKLIRGGFIPKQTTNRGGGVVTLLQLPAQTIKT